MVVERSAARRVAPGRDVVWWWAVLSLAASANVAAAQYPETAFTLRVKNEGGEGALKVTARDCTWDPMLQKLEWILPQPLTVANPLTNDAIATLTSARVQLYVGLLPRIQLDFGVEAGGATTSFVLEPGLIQSPPPEVGVPEARATVSLSVTDKNNNGAGLRAIGPPGTGIFQARFNGAAPNGYLFATMLYQILCGAGGSAKVSQYTPPVGYARLAFPIIYDMSTYVAFTLTAGDVAQGSTSLRFRYVETPAEAPAP
jgi:hypothetical protein